MTLTDQELEMLNLTKQILMKDDKLRLQVAEAIELDLSNMNITPQGAMRGSYKTIYFFDNDIAIAIEKINTKDGVYKTFDGTNTDYKFEKQRRINLYQLLDNISKQHNNCLINYPIAYYFIEKEDQVLLVSKLKYCRKGDIIDSIGKIPQEWLLQLMMTYKILHEYNIFHIDVKPDNILICECNKQESLFVADIDDAIVWNPKNNNETYKGRATGTTPYTPYYIWKKLQKKSLLYTGLNRIELEFADWYALAYIYSLNHYYKLSAQYNNRNNYTQKETTIKYKELKTLWEILDPIHLTTTIMNGRLQMNENFTPIDLLDNNGKPIFLDGDSRGWKTDLLVTCLQMVNTTNQWLEDDRKENTPPKFPLSSNTVEAMAILKDFIERRATNVLIKRRKIEKENLDNGNDLTANKRKDKKIKF